MFIHEATDLPEKVAAVRVGDTLIVRDQRQVKVLEALCNGCTFRVVLADELHVD